MTSSLLLGTLLLGCQAAEPAASTRPAAVDPNATDRRADQDRTITARQLMSASDITGVFRLTEGDAAPRDVPFALTSTDDGWRWTLEGRSQGHYGFDSEGTLLMPAEDDFGEKVTVHYDPSLIVLPDRLTEQTTTQRTARTRVTELDGDGQRASGRTRQRITGVWQRAVQTPMGRFDNAWIVRQERAMDLGLAKVNLTIDTTYAPGEGPVAQEVWQVEKLLFGEKESHFRLERVE